LKLEETTLVQKAAFKSPAPIAFSLPDVVRRGMPTGYLDFSDWNGALFLASPPFGMAKHGLNQQPYVIDHICTFAIGHMQN
jgi:hypothetical protein